MLCVFKDQKSNNTTQFLDQEVTVHLTFRTDDDSYEGLQQYLHAALKVIFVGDQVSWIEVCRVSSAICLYK